MTPIRERIAEAAAARLRTIRAGVVVYDDPPATVEYATSPRAVTRSLLDLDQYPDPVTQWPLLGVVRGSGSTVNWLTSTVWEHFCVFNIWGYVAGDDEASDGAVLAATRLEALWSDVLLCLRSDPTLSGTVRDSRPVATMDTDDGAYEPLAYFRQPWQFHTLETIENPAA